MLNNGKYWLSFFCEKVKKNVQILEKRLPSPLRIIKIKINNLYKSLFIQMKGFSYFENTNNILINYYKGKSSTMERASTMIHQLNLLLSDLIP